MVSPKNFFTAIVLISLVVLNACQTLNSQSPKEKIQWRTLAEAKIEAENNNLPCLVDFFVNVGCPRCEALKKNVYNNSGIVARINNEFIPVRIDLAHELTTEEQALAQEMETGGECMLLFLHADGKVIKDTKAKPVCSMAMLTPEDYMGFMDRALENVKK